MFSNRRLILPVFSESCFVGTISISSYAKVLREIGTRKPESIHVSEIIDKKLSTVSPNANVLDVMDRICEKGVYGVPVISGHEFIGMITREDVLKKFLHLINGKFKVTDVMSYYVGTISVHDAVEDAIQKIVTGDEKRLVALDYQKVEGVICIKDLANVLLAEKADLSRMSVKDILVPNIVTVSKHDDATKAGEIMLDWWVGGVPVVDGELEGIVKDKDIIQRLRFIM
ncbi:MAG: CBS domain-containing protein [Candidatus Altiarchaeota archaeon]|nr:CBS domain-containing protein [Candidatus Altiarchaeota archaeon]